MHYKITIIASRISTLRPPIWGTGLAVRSSSSSSTSSWLLSIRSLLSIRLITITAVRPKRFNSYGWVTTDFMVQHDPCWPFKGAGPLDSSQMSLWWFPLQGPTPWNGWLHLHITSYEIQLSLSHIGLEKNSAGMWPIRNRISHCTIVTTMMVIQLQGYAFCSRNLCLTWKMLFTCFRTLPAETL